MRRLDRLPENSVARDWLALAITAIACPVAVAAQWLAGCAGQGVNATCATDAVFVSPALLLLAGLVAGRSTQGWTGLFVVYVGGVLGMTSILGLALLLGHGIPFDPVSGAIATIWFMAPVSLGYGGSRLAWHISQWVNGRRPPTA